MTTEAITDTATTREKVIKNLTERLKNHFSERLSTEIFELNKDFQIIQAIVVSELIKSARRSVVFMDYSDTSELDKDNHNPMLTHTVIESLNTAIKDGLFIRVCSGISTVTTVEMNTTFYKPLVPLPQNLQFVIVDESLWYYSSNDISAYCANNTPIGDRLTELFDSFVVSKKINSRYNGSC